MNRITKTMIISLLLIIAMPITKLSAQVSVWDGTHEEWTHGTGTETDPFLIENAQQLAYLAYRVNNGLDANGTHVSNHDYHYKLMVDIDLNGSENLQWTPIGYYNSNTDYQRFGGQFNGNNHTVSGMYINSNAGNIGFWGNTDGATISNVRLYGSIRTSSGNSVGGFIGSASNTIIKNSINCCEIYSTQQNCALGGIIGSAGNVQIINCYNIGSITGGYVTAGIVGNASFYGSFLYIENCYNTGDIDGVISGGIVGQIDLNDSIVNSYNIGNLNGSSCGGIVGRFFYRSGILNCYYLNTCGGNNSCGGIPMSSVAMKTHEFVETLNNGSCTWEYDTNNTNSGYPVLTMLFVDAVTSDVTHVTQTHAILHGSINTENTSILSQGFEYKKTSDFNFQTVNVSGNGNMSTTISGLEPNTQYQYRIFCNPDNCHTFYGEEKTFTTLPVSVTTLPPSDVTANSAILNGYMDIGDATLVSKGFEYCEVGLTDFTTVNVAGNDSDFDAQIIGLQVNTTYEYRAFVNVAESSTTYYGTTRTFEVTWLNLDTICINNAEMLRWVSEQCNSGTTFENKCVKLTNDIVLPENVPNNMTSIGVYPNYPFKGTFDGNGKHITNLYIDQPNTPYQGFFGYTLNANLYNVGLVNITASGRNYTGGMVAYAKNTHMRDCYVNGGTLFALSYCGGLVGYQDQGTNSIISGCYNTCEVTGNNYVGGLIGFSNYSTVRNSYVASMVAAQGDAVGAIIGGANEVLMYYCYFNSELTGQTNAIGENNTGGGKDGGEAMTSAQMRDPQFVAALNQGLTVRVWKQDYASHINNGFPILQWQQSTGVDENEALAVAVYPNPANGKVTIETEDLKHITISNLLGQTIFDSKASGDEFAYDFSGYEAGVYLIRIETTNGVATKRVVVTR